MEERPGREQVFSCSEGLLYRPQLPVAEHDFQRIEVGVGAKHEDAIEFYRADGLKRLNLKRLSAWDLCCWSQTCQKMKSRVIA